MHGGRGGADMYVVNGTKFQTIWGGGDSELLTSKRWRGDALMISIYNHY